MMTADEIYGTDESKEKYFRIMPNHTVPKGTIHSVDGVQREKEAMAVSSGLFYRKLC